MSSTSYIFYSTNIFYAILIFIFSIGKIVLITIINKKIKCLHVCFDTMLRILNTLFYNIITIILIPYFVR